MKGRSIDMSNKLEWNAPNMNHQAWILDHLDELHVDAQEALVLLLIDFLNQNHIPIQHKIIADKCKIDVEKVEEIFATLSEKGYLTVNFENGKLSFCLDGLLDVSEAAGEPLSQSIIQEFEEEFGRGLSPVEMQKILELSEIHGERKVICALNEAAVYDHREINYIERILISWKNKGLTTEEVESGR